MAAVKPAPAAAPAKPAAPPAAASTAKPGGKSGADNAARDGKEPRIFVVPHAPDDPGPDANETEAAPKGIRPPYRAVP